MKDEKTKIICFYLKAKGEVKMKRAILAGLLAALGVGISNAWEHPQNPDRFPSIGLELAGQSTDGDWNSPSIPSAGKQNVEINSSIFILDTRLPLSKSFTLSLALGTTASESKADATPVLASEKLEQSGGYFSIGARYYFNH
jgi:hypothetical protein